MIFFFSNKLLKYFRKSLSELNPKYQAQKLNLVLSVIKEKCESVISETLGEINDDDLREEVLKRSATILGISTD